MTVLKNIRRDYGKQSLSEEHAAENPFSQFQNWFNTVLDSDTLDPTAMVLATVDDQGLPDTRVLLLKDWDESGFVFFTHYQSHKAKQIEQNPNAALNFYWPLFSRQIRIRGQLEKVSSTESETYFHSRPKASQICSAMLQQSTTLESRAELEQCVEKHLHEYADKPLSYPAHWGGYRLKPCKFEFFQGRDERMHDRLFYQLKNDQWQRSRLTP